MPILGIIASSWKSAGGDFESIATYTASGSTDTITFSSIPSTYKHLQIRFIARGNAATANNVVNIRANGDTGSNYAYHDLEGDGSSASAYGTSAQTLIYGSIIALGSASSNVMGAQIIDLLDYASTNKTKTFRIMGAYDNNGSGQLRFGSGLWNSTSAVTSISLICQGSGNTFNSASTFALYGIKG